VNFTNGYRNALVSPAQEVGSWTTLDFQLVYQLPHPYIRNFELTFNAQNFLNTAPPHLAIPDAPPFRSVGFDATNASPFGRALSLELSVAW
jgi:hypothetical protein